MDQFSSPLMRASATLPLAWSGGMVQTGDLQAGLELQSFDLQRLSALVGTPLGGTLSVRGRLAGPLEGLQPNLAISLDQPRVSSIALSELWSGRLRGGCWGRIPVGDGIGEFLCSWSTHRRFCCQWLARFTSGSSAVWAFSA